MPTDNLTSVSASQPAPLVPAYRYRHEYRLQNGDTMDREEFHRLYEQTPQDFKAELIGGVVYVASPLYPGHGKPHLLLGAVVAA